MWLNILTGKYYGYFDTVTSEEKSLLVKLNPAQQTSVIEDLEVLNKDRKIWLFYKWKDSPNPELIEVSHIPIPEELWEEVLINWTINKLDHVG